MSTDNASIPKKRGRKPKSNTVSRSILDLALLDDSAIANVQFSQLEKLKVLAMNEIKNKKDKDENRLIFLIGKSITREIDQGNQSLSTVLSLVKKHISDKSDIDFINAIESRLGRHPVSDS